MTKTANTNDERYDFFISYYYATGFHYAKHLKAHAKDFHRTAFLDKEDIHSDIKEETDEFRFQIDQGIARSKNFILVMTLGFNDRPEIKREWKIANNKGIRRFLFKKDGLDNQELIMETDEGKIDFSNWDYTPFNNEYDLLESVEDRLRGKSVPQKTPLFMREAKELVATEGLEIKQTKEPLLEMVVGPSDSGEEWLPPNSLNGDLLSMSPYSYKSGHMRPRRDFFEYEPYNKDKPLDFFLKITTNGFFHLVEPLRHDEKYYLDVIFHQILEMLLYCITVMKYSKLNAKQSVIIFLRNVNNLEVRLSQWQRLTYSFSNSDQKPFYIEFNPSDNWKEIGAIVQKLYGELCLAVSYIDVTDEIIKQRLCEIMRINFYNRKSEVNGYGHHIVLPAVSIDELGFTAEKKDVH